MTFKSIHLKRTDNTWWDRASKMGLKGAVEEVKRMLCAYSGITDIDVEKEAAISSQRYHYSKMCEVYQVLPLPFSVSLFKASKFSQSSESNANLEDAVRKEMNILEEFFRRPKLGWEICHPATNVSVISVEGSHETMVAEPKYRALYIG